MSNKTDPRSISAMIEQLSSTMSRLDLSYNLLDPRYRELQALIMCCPYPMWFKDTEFKMVFLNKAYELEFGVTVQEYNNKFDENIWPEDVAVEYRQNDLQVLTTQKPISVIEHHFDAQGVYRPITVVKWPLIVNNDLLGVAGMALGRAI